MALFSMLCQHDVRSMSVFMTQTKINSIFFSLQVLHETFPQHTFLMNGLIQGVKVRPSLH